MLPSVSAASAQLQERPAYHPIFLERAPAVFPNTPEVFCNGPQPLNRSEYWQEVCEHECSLTVEFDPEDTRYHIAPSIPHKGARVRKSLLVDGTWKVTLDSDLLNQQQLHVRTYRITELRSRQIFYHRHVSFYWPQQTLPAAHRFLELYQAYEELCKDREEQQSVKIHYQPSAGATVIFLLVRVLVQNPRETAAFIYRLVEEETGYSLSIDQLLFAVLAAKALHDPTQKDIFLTTYPNTLRVDSSAASFDMLTPDSAMSAILENSIETSPASPLKEGDQKSLPVEQTPDLVARVSALADRAFNTPTAAGCATTPSEDSVASLETFRCRALRYAPGRFSRAGFPTEEKKLPLVTLPHDPRVFTSPLPTSPSNLPTAVSAAQTPSSDSQTPSSDSSAAASRQAAKKAKRSCLNHVIALAKQLFKSKQT